MSEHIKEQARKMAREELYTTRRLQELDTSAGEARGYGNLLTVVQAHIAQPHELLESVQPPWHRQQSSNRSLSLLESTFAAGARSNGCHKYAIETFL